MNIFLKLTNTSYTSVKVLSLFQSIYKKSIGILSTDLKVALDFVKKLVRANKKHRNNFKKKNYFILHAVLPLLCTNTSLNYIISATAMYNLRHFMK